MIDQEAPEKAESRSKGKSSANVIAQLYKIPR
jgi:hypothetical protein